MEWETVIGLELHTQLSTRSKIFSGASTAFGAPPNVNACAVDLGLPGVLPVLNGEAVRMAVLFGLAVNASIARRSVFARKSYFYPDLPKGYQISQYELPIVYDGHVVINPAGEDERRIGITRAHLEEDAGKSIHDAVPGMTGVDLNRAGTPLIEIVSEPDLRSPAEAVAYMRKIHSIVRYLGISDGNMQEGSFRCDANISVRPRGEQRLGTRTEMKNINSFHFVERSLELERVRQIELLETGGSVVQETRLYDSQRDETRAMRGKEEANDYRYFPDSDLLPVTLSDAWIDELRATLPELPDARRARLASDYKLSARDTDLLTASREVADYFEAAVGGLGGDPKLVANWVAGELSARLNREGQAINDSPVAPLQLAELLRRVRDRTISGTIAKEVLDAMWAGHGSADAIIEQRGLRQVSDSDAIERMVTEVLAASPDQIEQYRAGKKKVLGYFVGRIMQASGGKADPAQVNEILKRKLHRDDST